MAGPANEGHAGAAPRNTPAGPRRSCCRSLIVITTAQRNALTGGIFLFPGGIYSNTASIIKLCTSNQLKVWAHNLSEIDRNPGSSAASDTE